MLQRGTESGLFCADKAYKRSCIAEENKAQQKVLLGKIKTEIQKQTGNNNIYPHLLHCSCWKLNILVVSICTGQIIAVYRPRGKSGKHREIKIPGACPSFS